MTQATQTNIHNDNASTRASAKPKNGRKGSRTTIETFKRCVAATVKARVNAAENPTLFEQREEERGALVWCALTLAPNMFQEEKRDRETAVAYVRGEYPTITEKEANSYISAASDNDSRRQRCTDVRKAAWRDVEYGRMSQDDAAKLGQVIKGLLPPRGERQFERMFDRCGDGLKESTARLVAKIIMNDRRYSPQKKDKLLTWLKGRVAEFCGDAEEAEKWINEMTTPQRPKKRVAENNGHRANAPPKTEPAPKRGECSKPPVEKPATVELISRPPAVTHEEAQKAFEGVEGEKALEVATLLLSKLTDDGNSETTRVINVIRGAVQTVFVKKILEDGGGDMKEINDAVSKSEAWVDKRLVGHASKAA
jgi:hypothetical protein